MWGWLVNVSLSHQCLSLSPSQINKQMFFIFLKKKILVKQTIKDRPEEHHGKTHTEHFLYTQCVILVFRKREPRLREIVICPG